MVSVSSNTISLPGTTVSPLAVKRLTRLNSPVGIVAEIDVLVVCKVGVDGDSDQAAFTV